MAKTTGVPLPEKDRRALRKLVEEQGERTTCEKLQVAAATLARAIAGMPIARTTTTHLQFKMNGQGG